MQHVPPTIFQTCWAHPAPKYSSPYRRPSTWGCRVTPNRTAPTSQWLVHFLSCLDPFTHTAVAQPCDEEGNFLPEGAPPGCAETRVPGDWSPFNSRDEFELANLLFTRTEMSHGQVDELMQIWAARAARDGGTTPFTDSKDLHHTIDAIEEGDAPWYSFKVGYNGDRPQDKVPSWMDDSHQVFYRDPRQVVRSFLSNRKFDGNFDYIPYREYENNERKWGDFMSGNFCWKQAVRSIPLSLPFHAHFQ